MTGKRYFYGCDTRLREGNLPRVDILPLDDGDALRMMRQMLARQGRGLTAEQWGCVTASLDQATALITYSRAGVSDAEMQDLLSLNDERVLKTTSSITANPTYSAAFPSAL